MSPELTTVSSQINGKEEVKNMLLLPTNGGDDTFSYYKNSYYQRVAATHEHQKITDEIAEKLDVETLVSLSPTIRIADFGCATGPNTIITVQTLIHAIKSKHRTQCPNNDPKSNPKFQVFFNDLPKNDFNTLFRLLPPQRGFFAAAVPGSFSEQIIPTESLHVAYSSHSLHWLSGLPSELSDEASPAWNPRRVHYVGASDEVVGAYRRRFEEEMEMFLGARAMELVDGGLLVMIMNGVPVDFPSASTANGVMFEFMASSLMEMVQEGLIKESQVDSFNLPLYISASPEDMRDLVDKNGCFGIERLELSKPSSWLKSPVDIPAWMLHVRAAMEGNFLQHFGSHVIVDEVFKRLTKKHLDHSDLLPHWCDQRVQLFVVLKRNERV